MRSRWLSVCVLRCIKELLKTAQEITELYNNGKKLGLSQEELAFYDALTKPENIKDFYRNNELIDLTRELLNNNYLVRRGVDYILVTYGSARIDEMTQADKYEFKRMLHRVFLDYLDIPVTAEFAAISNYTIFSNTNNKPYIHFYGFISWNHSSTPQDDWFTFIDAIVDHPYKEWISDGEFGFLHPGKDTQGKIRVKYNLVVEFFKTNYQIDLQKISDDLSSFDE